MKHRNCKKKNGKPMLYMPPSRNTVFTEPTITREEFEERWNTAFGRPKRETNGNWECTCNHHETKIDGMPYLITEKCKIHGEPKKIPLKITDIKKGFSTRQKKIAKEYIMYGNRDIREVTRRR